MIKGLKPGFCFDVALVCLEAVQVKHVKTHGSNLVIDPKDDPRIRVRCVLTDGEVYCWLMQPDKTNVMPFVITPDNHDKFKVAGT